MSEVFTLVSVKGTKKVIGTLADAIAAAIKLERQWRPAYGVEICNSGFETVADIRDGVDILAEENNG